ncbi:flagellin [Salipaludibacillus sp. CF4.18]|uniref:flagellin n=1 Tax=Salipaludibacillus sp. CF4.18 TaxID=3373081 RepID=UPI003EE59C88
MKINNNIPALNTYRHLSQNTMQTSKTLEKLSSGLRINRAADDAAGLVISEKMRAQIRGLAQAERNVLDGVSLIQTAEGGLSTIHEQLQRMRELTVQALNDTNTLSDREQIQKELNQLTEGIDTIANETAFNGIHLLNGTRPTTREPIGETEISPQNVLSANPVTPEGKLNFATEEGYPTTEADNQQRLIYGSGGTSQPSIRIGNTDYNIDEYLHVDTTEENGIHTTVFLVEEVEIKQLVQIVGRNKDQYEITYELNNTSGEDKEIGFQFHIDTMLGNDDRAPFLVNNEAISSGTVFLGEEIPAEFTVYNQNTGSGGNAEFQAQGYLKTTGEFEVIEVPSQFAIGSYDSVNNWNYTGGEPVGDSGYSIQWEERTVSSGGTFSVNTFYGQSVPPNMALPGRESRNRDMIYCFK